MAVVQLDYEENSTSLDEYLRYCQIIADAFTKALDQNECNVKVVVGIAQELTNQRDEVEDLWEIMKPDVYVPPTAGDEDIYTNVDDTVTVVDSPSKISSSQVAAIKQKLKEACYDCDYGLPSLDFNENFNWSFDKLKASLESYISNYKQITNPNFCHVSSAFNFACLQDLLKLIALLLSAYSAILALRKLSGISLSAFIKGVVSGLLGQLLGSVSLQMDLSKTGLSCLIKVFEDMANQIPDGSNMSAMMPEGFLENLGLVMDDSKTTDKVMLKEPIYEEFIDDKGQTQMRVTGYREVEQVSTVTTQGLDTDSKVTPKTDSKTSTESLGYDVYQSALRNLQDPNGKNILSQYAAQIRKDSDEYQENISNAFKYVNDTITQATDDFNGTISQLFGLLDYFQCEFARSGTDFLELLEYMQKLINVINLLSSIMSIVAKKQVEKLCKTKADVANFSDLINNEIILGGSNDLDPVDVIEEFLGKVVEETRNENDEIVPIIYDKDKEPMLPKLSLQTCNLKEFIEAHTIDNIIEKAVEEVRKEAEKDRPTQYDEYQNRYDPSQYPHVTIPKENIIDKDKWKVYPIEFVRPSYTRPDWIDKNRDDQDVELDRNTSPDYGLQSILDFVYNNPLDRTENEEKINKPSTPTPGQTDNNTTDNDKSYREVIQTPTYSPSGKDKKSFENECRSINDVLSILGNLQGK